jgi:FMN-dependent NADH-azoreductase
MPTLLHIDSSPRGDRSISRKLSRAFAEEWQRKNLDGKVVYRDLVMTNLPFVDVQWIGGAYSPPEEHTPEQSAALRISDDLVAEFLSADEIVLGTPMYNFNVPANVKAWIDHIVRVGKTFEIKDTELKGLVPAGRKATFIVASGSNFKAGGPRAHHDHESPYLQAIFNFIGITDTNVILAGDAKDLSQGKVKEVDFLKPLIEEVIAAA